jgi:hypothetical protein
MAMPKKKPPPFRLIRFVEVPRALVPSYTDRPWADVVAAAEAGTDGLNVVDADYFGIVAAERETAWLRENPAGGCFLFKQNWCDETNDRKWRRVP